MPVLPTAEHVFGKRPIPQTSRTVQGYRAGQEAGAAYKAGAMLEQGGASLYAKGAAIKDDDEKLAVAAAQSQYLRDTTDLRRKISEVPDYTKHEALYTSEEAKIRANALASVPNGKRKQLLDLSFSDISVGQRDEILDFAQKKENDSQRAFADKLRDTNFSIMENSSSRFEQQAALMATKATYRSLANKGAYSQEQLYEIEKGLDKQAALVYYNGLSMDQKIEHLKPRSSASFLDRLAEVESGNDPAAVNGSSVGVYQFQPATAKAYGLMGEGFDHRTDPVKSREAAHRLAEDNKASLTKALGREPTAGEIYLAHQQGAKGASELLKNPSKKAYIVLAETLGISTQLAKERIVGNGGSKGMTAGDFAKKWTDRFDGIEYGESSGERTASPLDHLPMEDRRKLLDDLRTSVVSSNLDGDPAQFAVDIADGKYDGLFTAEEKMSAYQKSLDATEKRAEQEKQLRFARDAASNKELYGLYTSGSLTNTLVDQAVSDGKISHETAQSWKDQINKRDTGLVEKKPLEERLAALLEIEAALSVQLSKDEGDRNFEDYVRIQDLVLRHSSEHSLTPSQTMSYMTKLMPALFEEEKDATKGGLIPWTDSSNPYSRGYRTINAWLKKNGMDKDVQTKADLLSEVVRQADAIGAAKMPDKERKEKLNEIGQAAIEKYQKDKNPVLLLFPATPNSIMKPDGSEVSILQGKSRIANAAQINGGFETKRGKDGNWYRVYRDGRYEAVP